jgi:hypothetical protein
LLPSYFLRPLITVDLLLCSPMDEKPLEHGQSPRSGAVIKAT